MKRKRKKRGEKMKQGGPKITVLKGRSQQRALSEDFLITGLPFSGGISPVQLNRNNGNYLGLKLIMGLIHVKVFFFMYSTQKGRRFLECYRVKK